MPAARHKDGSQKRPILDKQAMIVTPVNVTVTGENTSIQKVAFSTVLIKKHVYEIMIPKNNALSSLFSDICISSSISAKIPMIS